MNSSLDTSGLESVYDALAEAIDRVGVEKAELFLVKLALLNANAIGDAGMFRSHIAKAAQDL